MWPPPRSGRDGAPSAELEAPLLNPSKYPADLESVSDDCFLDDINTQVGWFPMKAATGAYTYERRIVLGDRFISALMIRCVEVAFSLSSRPLAFHAQTRVFRQQSYGEDDY